jgi:hypothetical protein
MATTLIGDAVLTTDSYEDPSTGKRKARTTKIGKLYQESDGRYWFAVPAHLLPPIMVADSRQAAKDMGYPPKSKEVIMNVLAPNGKPTKGRSEVADTEAAAELESDEAPF